jgi:hypothetical protein
MAVWNLDTPLDTANASTIHTLIQNVKIDVMERLRCTNSDTVDEHTVYGLSATGIHPLSQVGFVKIYLTEGLMNTFITTSFPGDGTLHYCDDVSTLFVKRGTTAEAMTTLDHGELKNLDILTAHLQYLDTKGTRPMTGNIELLTGSTLDVTSIGVEDTSPLSALHTTLHWYLAHGVDGISTDTYADTSITNIPTTSISKYDDFHTDVFTTLCIIPDYSFCVRAAGGRRNNSEFAHYGAIALKKNNTGTTSVGIWSNDEGWALVLIDTMQTISVIGT